MIKSMMKIGTIAAALAALQGASLASATEVFKSEIDGFQEVPAAIFTEGSGRFHARVYGDAIEYELTYTGLDEVIGAHIHFGRPGVNGGIIVFFCQDQGTPLGDPPEGVEHCPDGDQTITGVFKAEDVVGPEGQGIAPGDGEAAFAALLARATYINIHTNAFVSGEIRGAIVGAGDRDPY